MIRRGKDCLTRFQGLIKSIYRLQGLVSHRCFNIVTKKNDEGVKMTEKEGNFVTREEFLFAILFHSN